MNLYELCEFQVDLNHRSDAVAVGRFDATNNRIQVAGAEYEFVVQPRLAGHGPTLFAGLSKPVDLRLVSRLEFGSGAVAMRYEPRR